MSKKSQNLENILTYFCSYDYHDVTQLTAPKCVCLRSKSKNVTKSPLIFDCIILLLSSLLLLLLSLSLYYSIHILGSSRHQGSL